MNEIVVYPSKFKMALIAAGALMFVCFALGFTIWQDEVGTPWVIVIASLVGIPIFGSGFLYLCYRLIVPKPSVIVNHRGIFDNASILSAGLVKWDEIAYVYVYDVNGRSFLGIVPLDMEAFLQRQQAFKRRLMKFKMGIGATPINIPQFMLRMKVDELILRIQEYHQNHAG
jgi:hypothetical protein